MVQQRILKYLDFKGVSRYKFYKDTGLSNGYLDKKGAIGSDKCELICSIYSDLNPSWLITGNGNMLLDFEDNAVKNYKDLPAKLNHVVAEEEVAYGRAKKDKECAELLQNYKFLLEQKDVLINELKMLLNDSREAVKFSKAK